MQCASELLSSCSKRSRFNRFLECRSSGKDTHHRFMLGNGRRRSKTEILDVILKIQKQPFSPLKTVDLQPINRQIASKQKHWCAYTCVGIETMECMSAHSCSTKMLKCRLVTTSKAAEAVSHVTFTILPDCCTKLLSSSTQQPIHRL